MKKSKGWALVTGASAGLGVEFVRQLAEKGHDIILVARRRDRLEELASEVAKVRGVETLVLESDLGVPGATTTLLRELETRDIVPEVLINNAGIAIHGAAVDFPIEKSTQTIQLNVTALTELALAIGSKMAARGSGAILNVSSTASFQPNPYFAVYGATKAYVTNFSVALAAELAPRGVKVLAHCPGPTKTDFMTTNDVRASAGDWAFMTAKRCVQIGLRALFAGRWVVVTGVLNAIVAYFSRRSPLWLAAIVTGRLLRPSKSSRVLTQGS